MAKETGFAKSDSFNSIAIKSFRSDDKKAIKGQLTRNHYTSASALLSILRPNTNGETYLRFTDIRYMNDKSEKVYFVHQLLKYVQENRGKYPFSEEVINKLLLSSYSEDDYINFRVSEVKYAEEYRGLFQITRNFVFCTSKANDSLQMWNYYVHNGAYQGYNIEFDVFKFIKSFDTDSPSEMDPIFIHYGNVLYKEKEQFLEIETFIEQLEHKWSNQTDGLLYGIVDLWRYIETKGVFFKHESFAGEEEYRVVIEIAETRLTSDKSRYFNKNGQKVSLDFYERNGILVPFLKVPFPKESVKSVTMSPIMEYGIAKNSLEEFLRVNGYKGVEVHKSTVPIRF